MVRFIAHRGLSSMETENTAAAFVAAGNRGFFAIETDVRLTSDGVFVCFHDDDTKRLSHENLEIEKTDYKTLSQIRLLDTGGKIVRNDLVIPTVDEFIKICRRYEKSAVLELKASFGEEDISRLTRQVADYLHNIIFISFSRNNLLAVRKLLPNQRVQLLATVCNDELIENLEKNGMGLGLYYKAVTGELIEKIHRAGLVINCWTVDSPKDIQRLSDLGADYITTNNII